MQITAKLTHLFPTQTGTSKNGVWEKQDLILETDSQYSKKVSIPILGGK
jgi:hypothetical protein